MSKKPLDSDIRRQYIEGITSSSESDNEILESEDSDISVSHPNNSPQIPIPSRYHSDTSTDSETELTQAPIATKSLKSFSNRSFKSSKTVLNHRPAKEEEEDVVEEAVVEDEPTSDDSSYAISDIPLHQPKPVDRNIYLKYKKQPQQQPQTQTQQRPQSILQNQKQTQLQPHIQSNGSQSKETTVVRPRPITPTINNPLTKKLTKILEEQFDMEIYLKRREIETIKNEINLGLKKLKELSSEYKQKYKQKYNLTHLTNPKRSYLDEAVLYAKLDSGPFVRIHCPECNRCNFLNIQGFLNHCRISHNIEFPSHQEANLICGKPVPDSEVPKNHPCRNTLTKPLMNPVPEKFDLDTLKRNYRGSKIIPKEGMGLGRVYGIKVYDEDVDIMEDDYPLNKVKRINPTTAITSHTPAATPSPQHITPATTSNASQSQPQSQPNVEKSTVDQVAEETVQNEGEELTQPVQVTSPSAVQAPASVTCTTTQPVANYQLQHNGIPDHGSRFYIKKRIIIGNVSKYICPLDGQTSQPLFKWMVYVSGTTYDLDLTAYVRQVRFFLHPSYAPNDVIDLTAPPFHLTRYGWGEFPVRIQFFFHDDAKNNPVSFIHMLRLDWGLSGEQKLGGEIWLDLELDRNTKFLNSSNIKDQSNNEVQSTEKRDTAVPTINAPSTEDLKEKKRRKSISQKKFRPSDFGLTSEAHYLCLRQLERYPLITTDSSLDLPYRAAKDWEEFSQWDLSRKTGIEWYRAHSMKKSLLNSLDTLDVPSQTSLKQLTTRYLLNWLRYFDQSIKPLRSKISLYTHEDRRVFINFCKICGTLDRLNSNFRCELQFCKNFGLLKGGLNTLTNLDNLYSQVKLHKLKTLKQIKLESSGELEEGELLDEDDDLIVIDSDNEELEVDHTNSSVEGSMELSSQGAVLLKEVSSLVYRPVQKGIQTELKQLTSMLKPLNLRLINDKPPAIVKELLLASLKVFAINLIKGSVKCSKQLKLAHKPINSGEDEDEEDEDSKKHKNLLTPVHTYQFISNTQNLKFLTNENFGVNKVESKE